MQLAMLARWKYWSPKSSAMCVYAAMTRFANTRVPLTRQTLNGLRSPWRNANRRWRNLIPKTRADTEFAIANVRQFAQAQLATMLPLEIETLPGVHLGHRIIPIERVGCYVPGGVIRFCPHR